MVSEESKSTDALIELQTKYQVTSLLQEFSQKESEKDVNFSLRSFLKKSLRRILISLFGGNIWK